MVYSVFHLWCRNLWRLLPLPDIYRENLLLACRQLLCTAFSRNFLDFNIYALINKQASLSQAFFSVFVCVCVRERVCVRVRERMSVCERECVCVYVRERESVCERERECVCVWESVCVRQTECVWERERERDRECVCVCVFVRQRKAGREISTLSFVTLQVKQGNQTTTHCFSSFWQSDTGAIYTMTHAGPTPGLAQAGSMLQYLHQPSGLLDFNLNNKTFTRLESQ